MNETLSQRAVRSTGYLLVRRVLGYAVRFASVAVLARQLSVADFGLVAIGTTCINIMVVFGSAGIGTWVICDREEGWEGRARSAFWLNVGLTTVQVTIAAALVPLVVSVFPDASLGPVLAAMIATFFIEQMRVVPDSLLERRLDFRLVAGRDIVNDILTGAAGVAMALSGAGLWSLVLPRLVLSPLFTVATLWLARWTPGWSWRRGEWARIMRYAAPLMGGNFLHALTNDGDTLIVGKLLGATAAGFYNTAYQFANLVGRNVTAVLLQVSTPALAKVGEVPGALASACLRMYRTIALITTPLLCGMFAVADDIVLFIYGAKWLPLTSLLRLFILFTLTRSITSPSGAVLNILGRTGLTLRLYMLLAPLLFAGILIGSRWGVAGVALGVTVVRVLLGLVSFAVSLRMAGARISSGFLAIAPSSIAGTLMLALVWSVNFRLQEFQVPLALRLATSLPLGALLYAVLLRVLARRAFADLVSTIASASPRLHRIVSAIEQRLPGWFLGISSTSGRSGVP